MTDDAIIPSAINLAAARKDKDKDDGRLALMRTIKQTSILTGHGWLGGASRQPLWHSLGPHGGGGLAEKEDEAN